MREERVSSALPVSFNDTGPVIQLYADLVCGTSLGFSPIREGVVPWLPPSSVWAQRSARLLEVLDTFAKDFECGIMSQPSQPGCLPGLSSAV